MGFCGIGYHRSNLPTKNDYAKTRNLTEVPKKLKLKKENEQLVSTTTQLKINRCRRKKI